MKEYTFFICAKINSVVGIDIRGKCVSDTISIVKDPPERLSVVVVEAKQRFRNCVLKRYSTHVDHFQDIKLIGVEEVHKSSGELFVGPRN